jgi:hypothetical protein
VVSLTARPNPDYIWGLIWGLGAFMAGKLSTRKVYLHEIAAALAAAEIGRTSHVNLIPGAGSACDNTV